jgi:hypothetical protein
VHDTNRGVDIREAAECQAGGAAYLEDVSLVGVQHADRVTESCLAASLGDREIDLRALVILVVVAKGCSGSDSSNRGWLSRAR